MHPDELRYPALFHAGKAYYLERSDAHASSYFGGPFEGSISGVRHGPRALHHIATITGHCFEPLWQQVGLGTLRLLYGMCFDGCRLTYRNASQVEILEIVPRKSSSDWPYSDYPAYLPFFPLRLEGQVDCGLEEFLEASCQPLELESHEALVLVPPSPVLGMSLWGPSGDAEGTQLVFRYNLREETVEAFNQCG